MPTETKSDRFFWILPLGLIAILGAAFTGVTLARSTAPQVKPTPAATSPPSPTATITPTPTPKTAPNDTAMAQAAPTGLVTLKQSPNGCTPAFDAPNGEQVICFQSGTFKATGERDGFTSLSDGSNKFWIQSQFLEPAQQPSPTPSPLLPPQPEANWN